MSITILSDHDVRTVLNSLTREEVQEMHFRLRDALHTYSTSTATEDTGCCAAYQPERISIKRSDGSTTLFMPASGDDAVGVKIVTLKESGTGSRSGAGLPSGDLASNSSSPRPSSTPRTPRSMSPARAKSMASVSNRNVSPRNSIPSLSDSTSGSTKSSQQDSTFSNNSTQTSSNSSRFSLSAAKAGVVEDEDEVTTSDTSPKGSLTLLSSTGQPRALINASTLTAFRTALSTTLLLKLRSNVHTVTVFGAGLQAYWHIYLTLLLRGEEVHHLHLINRTFTRAQQIYIKLAQHPNPAINEAFLGGKLRPTILTPEYGEYERLLKEYVRAADVIMCTTPSERPLFPPSLLTNTEGRRKGRYVAAIGSYKPHMQELHEDILRQAVQSSQRHHQGIHLHHRHANEGGAVVVDTIEGAMKEAGEVIKAGISGRGIVELGELVMLKRSHYAEKAAREQAEKLSLSESDSASQKSNDSGHGLSHLFHRHHQHAEEPKSSSKNNDDDGGLFEWLQRGNVIYKGVGIGLMDVVVGMDLVRLAEEKGIGTMVRDF